jgi:hypothetical protein
MSPNLRDVIGGSRCHVGVVGLVLIRLPTGREVTKSRVSRSGWKATPQQRQALVRWEPRIEALEVAVTTDASEPTRLLIDIGHRVRATNNRFNLVYPFYLDGSAPA